MDTTRITTSHSPRTALDIAEVVRSGRRSAVEIVREHLDRIAERDPELSAFQTVRAEAALAEAAAVDARPDRATLPLAGVPVAVKDNIAVAGEPVRHGSAATADGLATVDDELVRRLRAAGCIVIGIARMPELAVWGFTQSEAFGATRNPCDPTLDPGGSSGGCAVAVATGMAALGLGTDGGGSLRIPAAQCGVVGLKPSAGLVPLPGGLAEHWHGLSVAGPIAGTVQDAAAALAVLSGVPVQARPVPTRLRVALSLRSPSPLGRPDAHQRAAVQAAAEHLRAAGHDVVAADPPYPVMLLQQWTRRWWAGVATDADHLGVDETLLERRTRTMIRKGRRVLRFGGPRPSVALAWRARATTWFDGYDVLLSPAVARTPGPAGEFTGRGYLPTFLAAAKSVPFTQAWNLAGLPALVVPVGTRAGLPLAVQLVGAPGAEPLLLGVGADLQRTTAGL